MIKVLGLPGESQQEFFEPGFYPGLPSISGRPFLV